MAAADPPPLGGDSAETVGGCAVGAVEDGMLMAALRALNSVASKEGERANMSSEVRGWDAMLSIESRISEGCVGRSSDWPRRRLEEAGMDEGSSATSAVMVMGEREVKELGGWLIATCRDPPHISMRHAACEQQQHQQHKPQPCGSMRHAKVHFWVRMP